MSLFALEKVQQLRTFLHVEGAAVTDTELYQLLRANGDEARAANAFLDCATPKSTEPVTQ